MVGINSVFFFFFPKKMSSKPSISGSFQLCGKGLVSTSLKQVMFHNPLSRILVTIEAKRLAFRLRAGLGKAKKHE